MIFARVLHRGCGGKDVAGRIEKLGAGERKLPVALPAGQQYETGMRRQIRMSWRAAAIGACWGRRIDPAARRRRKPAAGFPVGEVSGAEMPPTALIAIGPGGCELPPFTGTALPCTDQPLDGGGAGFSRGKSGTIMTTVLSPGFFFDSGGTNPICLGKALAAGAAWRA